MTPPSSLLSAPILSAGVRIRWPWPEFLPMNKPVECQLETVPLWLNGSAVTPAASRMGDVYNPATGQVVRRVPFCDASSVDSAVKAATAALAEWREWPPIRRARVMQRFLRALEESQKDLA